VLVPGAGHHPAAHPVLHPLRHCDRADVVRLVADLQRVDGVWKISGVTVLEDADPASAGSASGSSG
jgi:hypothetical protein